MINNVVLVGRVVEAPVLRHFEGDYSGTFLILAVARPFKSYDKKQEVDFIRVVVWEGLAENASLYCHKGDIVGIRGRLSVRKIEARLGESNDIKQLSTIDVIGERIIFISNAKRKKEDEVQESDE